MIEIATDTACILYLGLTIMVILGFWIQSHLASRKKKVVDFTLAHRQCDFCFYSYLDDPTSTLSRCPQCRLLNHKK